VVYNLGAKKAEHVKWLSVGHYIKIDNVFYRVVNLDSLIVRKTVVIPAGGEVELGSLADVEPEEGVMYAFLIGIQGPAAISVNQPSSIQRFGSRTQPRGYISYMESPADYPSPMTFIVTMKARPIDVIVKNLNSSAQETILLKFEGFKYELEEVKDPKLLAHLEALYKAGKLPAVLTKGIARGGR